jgi:hypothetical protein
MWRLVLTLAAYMIGALVLSACGSDGSIRDATVPAPTSDGNPRTFEMGLSSLPSQLTEESHEDAF